MIVSSPKMLLWCLIGVGAVVSAVNAAAQDTVLQIWNAGPGAGTTGTNVPDTLCLITCSLAERLGDSVTLTATPAAGTKFNGWAGDCSGPGPACTVEMDGPKLVIASFTPAANPLTVIHQFLPGSDGWSPGTGALLAYGGFLYGMTPIGGGTGDGIIFRELPDGSQHTVLHHFVGGAVDGTNPNGALIASGGVLYGMTPFGGSGACANAGVNLPHVEGCGTMFRLNPDGTDYTVLHSFSGGDSDGANPIGSLVAFDGVLYGMTTGGSSGTIFRINEDGSTFAVLHSFGGGAFDGASPSGSLVESGGVLYGMTLGGGAGASGTVFTINPDGSGFAVLHSFPSGSSDGQSPADSLVVSGGVLYGVTSQGGAAGRGTVFRVSPDGSGYAVLHSFAGGASDGDTPQGSLVASGGALYGTTAYGGTGAAGTIFRLNPDGSGFGLVHSFAFGTTDGAIPYSSLIASSGVLYGLTQSGGSGAFASGPAVEGFTVSGTVFSINVDGTGFAILHSFIGGAPGGDIPYGTLTAAGGELYGTTVWGGSNNAGVVFAVRGNGSEFTVLHSFGGSPSDGASPFGSLLAADGVLYGMTALGGSSFGGTVFKVNPDGSDFAILHSFAPGNGGASPYGSLVALGGVLYGMTSSGGADGLGTVFKINPDGSGFTILHSFEGGATDGRQPFGSLVTSGDVLFGMTSYGGSTDSGTIFAVAPDGSGYTVLHAFSGGATDGASPTGSPVVSGGVLYGMTAGGGPNGLGTIFAISTDGGSFELLHAFTGGTNDGRNPFGSLTARGDALYGTTFQGGANDLGTVFTIDADGSGFSVLASFAADDGVYSATCPSLSCLASTDRSLTALNGMLYGVTSTGGIDGGGLLFRLDDLLSHVIRRHLPLVD